MISFVDLSVQQDLIRDDLNARIAAVLKHGRYILGPEVANLEELLANRVGVSHCITCGNGTDALQIALMAAGVGPGDEVITPAFSYVAPAEAIALLGAQPVFVDVDPETYLIDTDAIHEAITERTRAIVPVSLFGQCSEHETINAIASQYGLVVIEDGAQSFGASHSGRKSGNLCHIGCTSFFPSKPLGCYGDGGAIFTDDPELALKVRRIARHGQDRKYNHIVIGVNSRLDTLQAAVLLSKLQVFDEEVERRNSIARRYDRALRSLSIATPKIMPGNTSVWAQYTVQLDNRDAIAARLHEEGVATAVYYPTPLNRQPALADSAASCATSETLSSRVLSLPMHPYLGVDAQQKIVAALVSAVEQHHG